MNTSTHVSWLHRAIHHPGGNPSRAFPVTKASRGIIASLILLIAVWTVSAVASRAHRYNAVEEIRDAASEPAVSVLATKPATSRKPVRPQQGPTVTESVLLTITPRGFDITEITVAEGPFFLLVENRSGVPEMSLRVNQAAGLLVKAADVSREVVDWVELLDLTPGSYVLSESGHPGKVCNLTVKAN
jgi:hypothetical protein